MGTLGATLEAAASVIEKGKLSWKFFLSLILFSAPTPDVFPISA